MEIYPWRIVRFMWIILAQPTILVHGEVLFIALHWL
jgi:hypothetical protein